MQHKRAFHSLHTTQREKNWHERLMSVRCFSSIISSITATMMTTPAITDTAMITGMHGIDSAFLFSSTKQRHAKTTNIHAVLAF